MPVDTFMAYVGVYPNVADAVADYELVKDLHTEAGLIDAYDAAVIERRSDGKVKITKKHETPTRVGGVLGGGVGLATGLVVALFPFAAIGGGLLAATAAGGAVLGAVAGHAAAGMSRDDLKELGERLDAGEAGLVVVAVSDMGAKVKEAMARAEKLEAKELKADTEEIDATPTRLLAALVLPADSWADPGRRLTDPSQDMSDSSTRRTSSLGSRLALRTSVRGRRPWQAGRCAGPPSRWPSMMYHTESCRSGDVRSVGRSAQSQAPVARQEGLSIFEAADHRQTIPIAEAGTQ